MSGATTLSSFVGCGSEILRVVFATDSAILLYRISCIDPGWVRGPHSPVGAVVLLGFRPGRRLY